MKRKHTAERLNNIMPATPAARLTDMHICPMVTPGTPPIPHVGGPITGPGAPTVIIGGQPAARVGDMAVCVGPSDTIAMGSATVITSGKPQARIADACAHGGKIAAGCPTVIVGDASGGGGGGGGGAGRSAGADMSAYQGFASIASAEAVAMTRNLIAAARHGTPFCEICYQAAKAGGVGEDEAGAIGRAHG